MERSDLLYPELSYTIVGVAFDVHNVLGPGHQERYYQRALAKAFTDKGLAFKQQVSCELVYRNEVLGKRFLDFLIQDKIIVEIKKGNKFSKYHIDQVLDYLKLKDLQLALLINFGNEGVQFKRIINVA